MLTSVSLSLLAMQALPAPTHSGPSRVLATQGTLEMEPRVMVGLQVCNGCPLHFSEHAAVQCFLDICPPNIFLEHCVLCCHCQLSLIVRIIHLQTSRNVWPSLLVMEALPAPTHLGPSHVLATLDMLAMDCYAMVGAQIVPQCMRIQQIQYI